MKINFSIKEPPYPEGFGNVFKYPDGIIRFTLPNPLWVNKVPPSLLTSGTHNGYVAVPESHRFFGIYKGDSMLQELGKVHGGLTYTDGKLIQNQKYWIFGFDTGHYGDTDHEWNEERVIEETKYLYSLLK